MKTTNTDAGTATVTAFGVFPDYPAASRAVSALRRAGFGDEQIGLLGPAEVATREKHSGLANDPTNTRWEEGTGIGAATGGLAGLGFGAAVAAGLISPIGPVLAGGTLVALLASAGVGATVGTIMGGLAGLGVPEDEAQFYASAIEAGRVLVTVRAADPDAAGRILQSEGAKCRPENTAAIPGNALSATPY
ncbi:MAG TPA: hypothetical protein VGE74_16465 [Gemmata sp.]